MLPPGAAHVVAAEQHVEPHGKVRFDAFHIANMALKNTEHASMQTDRQTDRRRQTKTCMHTDIATHRHTQLCMHARLQGTHLHLHVCKYIQSQCIVRLCVLQSISILNMYIPTLCHTCVCKTV